jgi:tetratricopeptide (TPR) repeat protein
MTTITRVHRNPSLLIALLLIAATTLGLPPSAARAEAPAAEQAERVRLKLDILNRYLEIVSSFHGIAKDPEKSAIFTLQQLEDVYKKQNKPAEVEALYARTLKDSKNRVLRTVAYTKLSEIYKNSGRHDEAIALLQKALDENLKAVR